MTELTVTLHIDGKQVDTLSDQQRQMLSEKLSSAMSVYYTAHDEELGGNNA